MSLVVTGWPAPSPRQARYAQPDPAAAEDHGIHPDNGGFKRYVSRISVPGDRTTGLCGWTWIQREAEADTNVLPTCPLCQERYDSLPTS